jgi:hypothetical protein
MDLPPLVTTSPLGTSPASTGLIGGNGTEVLFGDESINDALRSGGRITLGWFQDKHGVVGYEASYLGLASDGDTFSTSSDRDALIARPVFDTGTSREASQLIAHPDFLNGSISIQTDNDLHFFDLIRRQRYAWSSCYQFDVLVGYRHARMDESLRIEQSSRYTAPQGQIISGTTLDLIDQFGVENRFHGAQIGFDHRQHFDCWTLATTAKVGLGIGHSEVSIAGQTVTEVPNAGAATFAGGLLAQETNQGTYRDADFVVIPEASIRLINRLNRSTSISVGYQFLYWSRATRLADQIDRNVSQFPPEPPSGQRRPRFDLESSGLLLHGLSAGVEYTF